MYFVKKIFVLIKYCKLRELIFVPVFIRMIHYMFNKHPPLWTYSEEKTDLLLFKEKNTVVGANNWSSLNLSFSGVAGSCIGAVLNDWNHRLNMELPKFI